MYKLTETQICNVIANASGSFQDYCIKNDIHFAVVGSSGGLDSAVTLKLANIAANGARARGFDLTIVGLIMPCQSSDDSVRLGQLAIEAAGAEMMTIPLEKAWNYLNSEVLTDVDDQIVNLLKKKNQGTIWDWEKSATIAQGNIKARLRMMLGTYHVARMLNGLVLSTDNLSELYMGFWTLHGDVGDYGMIQQVFKGLELYDIARYLGVPQEIINAKPDDGLGVTNGGDEEQLGAPYEIIDKIMVEYIKLDVFLYRHTQELDIAEKIKNVAEETGFNKKVVDKILRRHTTTKFKRIGPINLTREDLGLPDITEMNEEYKVDLNDD
jgi:NAD+ synthetase